VWQWRGPFSPSSAPTDGAPSPHVDDVEAFADQINGACRGGIPAADALLGGQGELRGDDPAKRAAALLYALDTMPWPSPRPPPPTPVTPLGELCGTGDSSPMGLAASLDGFADGPGPPPPLVSVAATRQILEEVRVERTPRLPKTRPSPRSPKSKKHPKSRRGNWRARARKLCERLQTRFASRRTCAVGYGRRATAAVSRRRRRWRSLA